MTPLERAARAVADVWWDSHHFGNDVPRYNWDRLHPAQRKASFATARAVLMAVRDCPIEAECAGLRALPVGFIGSNGDVPKMWSTMIDAILADGGE